MNNNAVYKFTRHEELIYLAGLFDGEGCAGVYRHKSNSSRAGFTYVSLLTVHMCDASPVEQFHDCFGGTFDFVNRKLPRKGIFRWTVVGKLAAAIAAQLLPFSHNPRKAAALRCVIDFGKTVSLPSCTHSGVSPEALQRRELLRKKCCALNATGADANNQTAVDLQTIEELKSDTTQLLLWD